MKTDESLGFESEEKPKAEPTADELLGIEPSADELLFADEEPGWLKRQLGYVAQIPTFGFGAMPETNTRIGDISETAREWYNEASSVPWRSGLEAAASEDPDAAVRARDLPPVAAVRGLAQGGAALLNVLPNAKRSIGADRTLKMALEGDESKIPAEQMSFILQREFPGFIPPEDATAESVKAAALALYSSLPREDKTRLEYPVLDRVNTGVRAVPGAVKESLREYVDLFGGVVEGDPGKTSVNASPLVDLVGVGMTTKLGKAAKAKALTANASDAAEAAVRGMRHDAPAAAFDEIENISDMRPATKGYALAPEVSADDLVVAELSPVGVSDLPGPPVDYQMIKAALERDLVRSSADFPGGRRVPDAIRSNPSEFLSDDLTPGAKPSNVGNLPPKPSTPVGDFMINLAPRAVDDADIISGTQRGLLPDIPTSRADRPGFQSELYEAGRRLGGNHALVVEKLAKSAGFRREAKLSLEHVKAMIENPDFTLENWDRLSEAARKSPDDFEALLREAAPVQAKPNAAPAWRNTGVNKSFELPPADVGLGELYEAARRMGGPQKAVADIFSDHSFRSHLNNEAWTPERIREAIARPELLRDDGDLIKALTLRNRDLVVENFVKSNGKAPDELVKTGSRASWLSKNKDTRYGVGLNMLATNGRYVQIPEWDKRFPASTRGHWIERADLHRLDQVLGGRSTVFSGVESIMKKNLVVRNPLAHIHAAVDDSIVQFMDGGTPTSLPRAIAGLNGKGDGLDAVLAPEFIKRYTIGDYISEDQIGVGVPSVARGAAMRAARTGNLELLREMVSSKSIRESRAASRVGTEGPGPVGRAYEGTLGRALDSYDAAAQSLWILRDYGHRYAFFRREIERRLNMKMNGKHKLSPEQRRSLAAKIAEDPSLLDSAAAVADERGFDYANLPQWAVASRALGVEPFAGFKVSSSAAFYEWAGRNPVELAAISRLVVAGREYREQAMARQQAERVARTGKLDMLADVGPGSSIDQQRLLPTSIVGLSEGPWPNMDDLERGRFGLYGKIFDVKSIVVDGIYPDGRPVTDERLPEDEQYVNRAATAARISGMPHWLVAEIVNQLVDPQADAPGSGRPDFASPISPYDSPEVRAKKEAYDAVSALVLMAKRTKWAPKAEPKPYAAQIREAREGRRVRSRDPATASSRAR